MAALTLLFAVAGALTSLWLGGVALYLAHGTNAATLLAQTGLEAALFALAAFGPVAGLWLAVGCILVGIQSHRLMIALRLLAGQNRRSADALETQSTVVRDLVAGSSHAGNAAVLQLALDDINSQLALLADRLGVFDSEESETLWRRLGNGDLWGISYAFLGRAALFPEFPQLLAERLAPDTLSQEILNCILSLGDGLMTLLAQPDTSPIVRRLIGSGPLVKLIALFRQVKQVATTYTTGMDSAYAPASEDQLQHPSVAAPIAASDESFSDPERVDPFQGMTVGALTARTRHETLGAQLGREESPISLTTEDSADASPSGIPEDIADALRQTIAAATLRAIPEAPVRTVVIEAAPEASMNDPLPSDPEPKVPEVTETVMEAVMEAVMEDGGDETAIQVEGEIEPTPEAAPEKPAAAPETKHDGDIEASLNRLQEALRRMNEDDSDASPAPPPPEEGTAFALEMAVDVEAPVVVVSDPEAEESVRAKKSSSRKTSEQPDFLSTLESAAPSPSAV